MSAKHSLYLKSLHIKNFATFHEQMIIFHPGANAIIGETGAGKSLILDALQILLGARANKLLIRKEASFAIVEGIFHCQEKKIEHQLDKWGYPCEGEEIVIKRILYPSGGTKSFLNHHSCNSKTIGQFAHAFIDLVGQFANQRLLQRQYQLALLDQYAHLGPLRGQYYKIYQNYLHGKKTLEEYLQQQNTILQKGEFLKFQLNEIDQINPSLEKERFLLERKQRILLNEKSCKIFNEILSYLDKGEGLAQEELGHSSYQKATSSMLYNLKKVNSLIKGQTDLIVPWVQEHLLSAQGLIEDVTYFIARELEQNMALTETPMPFDWEENTQKNMGLEDLLTQLDQIEKLKRKYGGSLEQVLQYREKLQEELAQTSQLQVNISQLQKEIQHWETQLYQLAGQLHEQRLFYAQELSQVLTQNVRTLNMVGATINLRILLLNTLTPSGLSEIEFLAETNAGEGAYLIKNIASGGELSRILLAFRQIISATDAISIFLFDEIDTGMGGETALRVGASLAQVAKFSQVIAITHLPQIAHYCEKLIVVSKEFEGESQRTISKVREVSGSFIAKEVGQMIPLPLSII